MKILVHAYGDVPEEDTQNDHEALRFLRDLRSDSGNYAAERKNRLIQMCLQDIADAQGDTEAYIAQYTDQDLARPSIAAEVAQRLLAEQRAGDALEILRNADHGGRVFAQAEWDAAYIASLIALDRIEEAQAHRLARFGETLNPDLLRDYLKVLPDFDDVEAEDKAKAQVHNSENVHQALAFFLGWPDLPNAARLIEARAQELDGDYYHLLAPAADALREKFPLAAMVLWRTMIDFALLQGRSTRYGHAADHLMDCAAVDGDIVDYGPFAPHHIYLAGLHARHERKASFWKNVH